MTFSIRFLDEAESVVRDTSKLKIGVIVIGNFEEHFEASLSYWSIENYQKQWRQALERIKSGETKSSLITSMYDPQTANFITWWPLYRDDQQVRVQNQLLFMDQINGLYNLANPYVHVPDRAAIDEDGNPISEWRTTIAEIEEFLKTL